MDDVERMYRHLVRTIRSTSPQLLTQPFQVADLYATILPYRLHRWIAWQDGAASNPFA